jgi:hypothetical protein
LNRARAGQDAPSQINQRRGRQPTVERGCASRLNVAAADGQGAASVDTHRSGIGEIAAGGERRAVQYHDRTELTADLTSGRNTVNFDLKK